MKKFMAIFIGIVLGMFCVMSLVGCYQTDVETINQERYEKAIEKANNDLGGFGNDITVEPKITRDGLVVSYKVLVDGNYSGQIDFK